MGKARLFSQLITGNGTIKATKLGADVPITENVATADNLPSSASIGEQAFVEDTNRLYIWNGSGWYNIALINTSPTWDSGGQPSGSYVLDNDSPQDATVITLSASDPDGLPISYSYVTSGSMDSMATISQDSSVFTITPKTVAQVGEDVELTGSITFRASDGVNILPQVSSFTLNFVTSVVENSKYTTLLVTAIDTSDNNNITDSSTNNHTITVTGDVQAGTFSPYRHGGYSTYFDGTGDYLLVPDDSTLTLTGDQTIEAFVYLTAYNTSFPSYVVSKWQSNNDEEFVLSISTTGVAQFWFKPVSGSAPFLSGGTVSLNTWTHLAVVRSGNDWALFVDGNRVSNGSNTGVYTDGNSAVTIGSLLPRISGFELTGYISDVRLVKGTAVYSPSSTTLTVPTKSLAAVANTSLLTCHLPYIADGSSNGHSITVNGNTSTKPFTPYDYPEYSASNNGGSIHRANNSSGLLINNQPSPLGNDFTYEGWFYLTTAAGTSKCLFTHGWPSAAAYGPFVIYSTSTTYELYMSSSGTSWDILSGQDIGITQKINTWVHYALTRQGNTIRFFENGSQTYTTTISGSLASTTSSTDDIIGIGMGIDSAWIHNPFYVEDFRYTNGTAVYTSNFTPPTAPLSSTGSTLHIKGTDASVIDLTQRSNPKIIGNATGSTTQVKFTGSKSIYVPSAGVVDVSTANCVRIDEVVLTNTESFTYEFWMKLSSTTNTASPYGHTNSNRQTQWNEGNVTGNIMLYMDGYIHQTTGCYSATEASDWMHVAYSFDQPAGGNNFKLFINGTQRVATFLGTWIYINTIGAGYLGYNAPINGYLQDFRVTKGLARYTSNFTPPTESLKG